MTKATMDTMDACAERLSTDGADDLAEKLWDAGRQVSELLAYRLRVEMIPHPVGSPYREDSDDDRAYRKGFDYALKLARGGLL